MLHLSCVRLPETVTKKLIEAGFIFVEDLFTSSQDLKQEVENISKFDSITKTALRNCLNPLKKSSALDLLENERKLSKILTFCYKIDQLLGGGVPTRGILEVCGPPGSGKSQLCLQLCVSVQLHSRLGGLEGEAIFIDTDAGFSPQRLQEIANDCKEHCCKVARANKFDEVVMKCLEEQTFSEYYYIAIGGYSQLLTTVLKLDDFVENHKNVRVVIIDSLAFPFLHLTDMLQRTSLLCKILQNLKSLATKHNLSVVVTNQLTTKITRSGDELIPALGESVGYFMDYRMMMGFLPAPDNNFAAVLFKSPFSGNESAEFRVTTGGVRDVQ